MGSDIQALLDSNIAQPMAQIFYQSFGQKGTLAIWSIVVIVQSAITIQTFPNVTNGFALQVYDGVKHGECWFHMSHNSQASGLMYGSRCWLLRGRHLPFLETALCHSRPRYTG